MISGANPRGKHKENFKALLAPVLFAPSPEARSEIYARTNEMSDFNSACSSAYILNRVNPLRLN